MQEKIIALIKEHPELFNMEFKNNSADDGSIANAEKALGLKFNDQFIWFLKNGISGNRLYGKPENCVAVTNRARKKGLPLNLLAIKHSGEYEEACLICIDTETGKVIEYFFVDDDEVEVTEQSADFYSYYYDFLNDYI